MIKNKTKLYKYLKKDHWDSMVKSGEIQIGTLLYYKNLEDKSRGDKNEGKKTSYTKITEDTVINDPKNYDKCPVGFSESFSQQTKGTSQIIMKNGSRVNLEHLVEDKYIYCCSTVYSKDLMKKFGDKEKKEDAVCVEIINPEKFFKKIFKILKKEKYSNILESDYCKYYGHEIHDSIKIPGYFLKDEDFKDEGEYRFVFHPKKEIDSESIKIYSKKIMKYCKLV